jgi:hypothetical protein
MGKLKEGTVYIYERVGPVVYARESGSSTRTVVGIDYPLTEPVNWHDVEITAKTNPALQSALERAILLYKLCKEKYE